MAIKITDPKIRVTMINDKVRMYLLPPLFNAAVRAGASIMRVYKNLDDYDISLKDDKTPITLADRVAHKTIREYLGPTRIPILSEEGRKMRYEERRNWELYWLVDPLDGTVEFIKGNNEFTVNIALMENNVCMGAVIYVPYFEKLYIAGRDAGSYVKEHVAPDSGAEYTYDEIVTGWTRLPLECEAVRPHPRLRVAVSRSHQTPETAEHIARLRATHPDLEIVEQGSSYKFCLLAEGRVDYYVRTTHTYEWDTAAGELILAEAGGHCPHLPGDVRIVVGEIRVAGAGVHDAQGVARPGEVVLHLLHHGGSRVGKIDGHRAAHRGAHLVHQSAWLAKINIFRILANFRDFYRGYFIIVIKVRNDRSNQCLKRCGRG